MSGRLGTALAAAALITSSALWHALVTGEMPVATALTRFVVVCVASWFALGVVSQLVFAPDSPAGPGPLGATNGADGRVDDPAGDDELAAGLAEA